MNILDMLKLVAGETERPYPAQAVRQTVKGAFRIALLKGGNSEDEKLEAIVTMHYKLLRTSYEALLSIIDIAEELLVHDPGERKGLDKVRRMMLARLVADPNLQFDDDKLVDNPFINAHHWHRCGDCGAIFDHDRSGDEISTKEYMAAHMCPSCAGGPQRVAYNSLEESEKGKHNV